MHLPIQALYRMNLLTLCGLVAVSLTLLFYALENRSPIYVLGFAAACLMGGLVASATSGPRIDAHVE